MEIKLWQMAKDGKYIELNLAVNSEDETRVKIAESIKEQLEDAGIKIYINKVSLSTYNSYLKIRIMILFNWNVQFI